MEKINFKEIISDSIQTVLNEELNPAFEKKINDESIIGNVWSKIENFRDQLAKSLDFTINDNTELKTLEGEQAKIVRDRFNSLDEVSRKRIEAFGAKTNIMGIPNMLVKAGNDKLPENVLIVNLTSALLCPSYHLGTCTITDGICYAQSDENRFGVRQETKVKKEDTRIRAQKTDIMNFEILNQYRKGNKEPMNIYFNLIESYIDLGDAYAETEFRKRIKEAESINYPINNELKKYFKAVTDRFRIKFIRINESGDFPCQLSVDLWTDFAKRLNKNRERPISIHAYTARYLDFTKATEDDYMVINPSHLGINTGYKYKRIFKVASDTTIKYFEQNNMIPEVNLKNYQPILFDNPNFNKELYLQKKENGEYLNEENIFPKCYICPCNYKKNKYGEIINNCNNCQVCFHPNKTGTNYIIYVKEHGASANNTDNEKETNGLKNTPAGNYIEKLNQSMINNGFTSEKENQIATSKAHKNRIKKRSQKENVKSGEKDRNTNRQFYKQPNVKNNTNDNIKTNDNTKTKKSTNTKNDK